jgi:hypothetical protein
MSAGAGRQGGVGGCGEQRGEVLDHLDRHDPGLAPVLGDRHPPGAQASSRLCLQGVLAADRLGGAAEDVGDDPLVKADRFLAAAAASGKFSGCPLPMLVTGGWGENGWLLPAPV